MSAENYRISILWGEAPEDDDEPTSYIFETKAEMDAFTLGISEMDGWQGYDIVSHGRETRDVCYIERFNECAEQVAKTLDAWFDTDTQDMTLINELIEKHIERKNHEQTYAR